MQIPVSTTVDVCVPFSRTQRERERYMCICDAERWVRRGLPRFNGTYLTQETGCAAIRVTGARSAESSVRIFEVSTSGSCTPVDLVIVVLVRLMRSLHRPGEYLSPEGGHLSLHRSHTKSDLGMTIASARWRSPPMVTCRFSNHNLAAGRIIWRGFLLTRRFVFSRVRHWWETSGLMILDVTHGHRFTTP